jgi:hypothetical protein
MAAKDAVGRSAKPHLEERWRTSVHSTRVLRGFVPNLYHVSEAADDEESVRTEGGLFGANWQTQSY